MTAIEATAAKSTLAEDLDWLRVWVDGTATREDVVRHIAFLDTLVGEVKALPPVRPEWAQKARARLVSGVTTARIHLTRAGVNVALDRGCRLASEALVEAIAAAEIPEVTS